MSTFLLDFLIRTRTDGSAAGQAEQSVKGATQATQQLQRTASATTAEMKQFGGELRNVGKTARETHEVMEGLEQGGVQGTIRAFRGATGIVKEFIATGIGGPFLVAAAAAAAAIVVMNKVAEENRKEMEDWAKARETSAERYKKATEESMKAGEKSLKEELKAVQELTKAYADLGKETEQASKRFKTLDSAKNAVTDAQSERDKQRALAGATTPEQRQQIEADFARKSAQTDFERKAREFDNAEVNANVRIQNAEKAKAQARAENDASAASVREAESKARDALEATHAFKPSDDSAAAQAARRDARVAQEDVKRAREGSTKIGEETQKTIDSANATIDEARLVKEETALRRQAYQAIIEGKAAAAKAPNEADAKALEGAAGKTKEAQDALKGEQDRLLKEGGFGDKGKTSELSTKLSEARAAQDAAEKEVVKHATEQTKNSKQLEKQIKTLRESNAQS